MKQIIFYAYFHKKRSRIRNRVTGSQRYGSADPDPHQNVTDPQLWKEDLSSTSGHCVAGVVRVSPRVRPARQTPKQNHIKYYAMVHLHLSYIAYTLCIF